MRYFLSWSIYHAMCRHLHLIGNAHLCCAYVVTPRHRFKIRWFISFRPYFSPLPTLNFLFLFLRKFTTWVHSMLEILESVDYRKYLDQLEWVKGPLSVNPTFNNWIVLADSLFFVLLSPQHLREWCRTIQSTSLLCDIQPSNTRVSTNITNSPIDFTNLSKHSLGIRRGTTPNIWREEWKESNCKQQSTRCCSI